MRQPAEGCLLAMTHLPVTQCDVNRHIACDLTSMRAGRGQGRRPVVSIHILAHRAALNLDRLGLSSPGSSPVQSQGAGGARCFVLLPESKLPVVDTDLRKEILPNIGFPHLSPSFTEK